MLHQVAEHPFRVEVEEEEEEQREREEEMGTEAQREVLEVIKQVGKASAKMVNDALGGRYSTVWKQLNALCEHGQLQREFIGKSPYYFLPAKNGNKEEPSGQLEFIKNPD